FIIDSTAFVSGEFIRISTGGDMIINGYLESLSVSNPTISCSGNFLQKTNFSFIPGTSIVELHGSDSYANGQFYELYAFGSSIHSQGNIFVAWKFGSIGSSIIISPSDTLFIQDTDPSSFYTLGSVSGAISRAIRQGSTDYYDFDEVATYLKFNGTGTYPASVVIDAHPIESPATCGEQWIPVASSLDTSTNIISTDNIHDFSKWAIGIVHPGSTLPVVQRYFVISAAGGGPFTCKLSLHYESSEVPPGTPEDSLVILRSDATSTSANISLGWNLLSLPNKRTSCNLKTDYFPDASSNAFKFDLNTGTYAAAETLVHGVGYWVKFPGQAQHSITGYELTKETLSVSPGWNMIGTLSNELPASSVASVPPGLISGPFFEYDGGYVPSSVLKPAHGYWVKIGSPGGKLI
ncbi:MAG TPA: hypothetical protein VJ508_05995, partial [Saprospiraceae bacterium]|nr:hypothetical protein [Saprospiraceae bacterium]